MSIETLKEKAKSYNISQEYLDSKEKGRLEFLAKFPKDKISKLTLDEYVLGTGKESFCYWLEFKKIDDKVIVFGIGGGNASKFGLYKSKDGLYQTGYGENKKALSGKDLDDYFNSIKDTIILALKCLEEDRIKDIKQMDIPFGNMILQKILSIYYPEKFITIGASNVLIDFAKDIKLQKIELTPNNLIEINFECKKAIDKLPEFQNWPYEKIGTFIWENYRPIEEEKSNNSKIKYWLYAPGENAELWDEFYKEGIMGLGWDELGDLNDYSSKEELTTKLQELEKTTGSKKNDSTANFEFKDVISIGDVIISKKGRGELLGYGIVTSDYYYDKERTRYQKCRKVNWEKKGNWKTDHSLALKTLTDITKYPSEHPDYEKYYDKLLGIMNNNKVFKNYKEEYTLWLNKTNQNDGGAKSSYLRAIEILSTIVKYNIFEKDDINKIDFLYEDLIKEQRIEGGKYYNEAAPSYGNKGFYSASIKTYSDFLKDYFSKNKTMPTLNFSAPLNKILYGPPGTGKTYNTLLLAAQIIKRTNDLNYDTAKVVFNENLGDKIEFITFHQNYSYEDFIQGLRPDVEVKGNLSFERKDGVFARIAINALFEYFKIYSNRKRKLKTTDQNLDVNEVYLSFFNFLKSNPNQIFKTKTGSDLIIKSYSERKCLRFSHSDSSVIHTVSGDRLIKLYEKFPAIEQIKNVHKDITEVLGGCNATVYWTALNEFIKYYKTIKGQRKDIAEEDLINYEDISFEEKKEFLNTIELSELYKINSEEVPNYVIIIDEINRANISRVFGELITLIEPDKRSHGELPLKCTLPSGEEFIVPSNLYIIGTMNTADKSIALLDIALRRRFEFQAMYPDYEIEGIYDLEILKKINSKIIELKGYDFQIGHSYFMNSKDDKYNLTKRMNKKVIPLLLEYFMNNREEVEKIISHSGLTLKNGSWPLEIID
jgi:Cdc6-like AAA superfamily ATPase